VKVKKEIFQDMHEAYTGNVLGDAMIQPLADELGVSVESLMRLGIGCRLGDGNRTYTFPVRDRDGELVGIQRRYENGKKFFMPGSGQGLFFEVDNEKKTKHNRINSGGGDRSFIRVEAAGVTCKVCGKPDWCLVESSNPNDPSAAICGRVKDGSVSEIPDSGFLHILKSDGDTRTANRGSDVLPEGEDYVLVTEGATDTAAGLDLGFFTVGRTNALCGTTELPDLLRGRKVIVVGDNDTIDAKEVGQKGMNQVAAALAQGCPEVIKILPPTEYKDLRSWCKKTRLTHDQFMDWVKQNGESDKGANVLSSDIAFEITKVWLARYKTIDGLPTIRLHRGEWAMYDGTSYNTVPVEQMRGELYEYLNGKMFINDKGATVPYKVTRAKMGDLVDSMGGQCYIDKDVPCWIDDEDRPAPINMIPFLNGILDVAEYVKGNIKMIDPTPALFSYNVLPYNFDEDAHSQVWEDFVYGIYNDDQDKYDLLSEWFGYNLVPDMSYEKLMLLTGAPRSGKGTVLSAMIAMLGHGQYTSSSFQALNSEFGYQSLHGKLAVIMGDAKITKRNECGKALEKILQIVGGDTVGIRKMYSGNLKETRMTCRFTMAMNDLPNLPDGANALGPRMNVLCHPNSYVGREDRGLKRRLEEDAAQGKLINFALTGLKSLRKNRMFSEASDAKQAISQMRELTQPVSVFLEECCELMPPGSDENEYHVDISELYEAWAMWCKLSGRKPGNNSVFGRWMAMACPTISTTRITIAGRRRRVYRKIKLAPWVSKEYFGV
jgi:putative DNA primase/helicase